MKLITEDAVLRCDHQGSVHNQPGQSLVTVAGKKVLVEIDPEGRQITGCPMISLTTKPCTNTLKVTQGYSTLMKVSGKRVCLDTVLGLTDGFPPGVTNYKVYAPGQTLVSEAQG
jgi:hypothetical protein